MEEESDFVLVISEDKASMLIKQGTKVRLVLRKRKKEKRGQMNGKQNLRQGGQSSKPLDVQLNVNNVQNVEEIIMNVQSLDGKTIHEC